MFPYITEEENLIEVLFGALQYNRPDLNGMTPCSLLANALRALPLVDDLNIPGIPFEVDCIGESLEKETHER